MNDLRTTARVKITVEITQTGSWSRTCSVEQVHSQAAEAAIGYLQKLSEQERGKLRVVGKPAVTAVMATEAGHE